MNQRSRVDRARNHRRSPFSETNDVSPSSARQMTRGVRNTTPLIQNAPAMSRQQVSNDVRSISTSGNGSVKVRIPTALTTEPESNNSDNVLQRASPLESRPASAGVDGY